MVWYVRTCHYSFFISGIQRMWRMNKLPSILFKFYISAHFLRTCHGWLFISRIWSMYKMNTLPSSLFKFKSSAYIHWVMAANAAFLFCSSRWVEDLDGSEIIHIVVIEKLTTIPPWEISITIVSESPSSW